MTKFKQWTPREVVAAQAGRKQGLTNKEIGVLVNRDPNSVRHMFGMYGAEPLENFLKAREQLAEQRRLNGIKGREKWAECRKEKERQKIKARKRYGQEYKSILRGLIQPVGRAVIPPDVIAERDRRLNEYRTPAQIQMGDPPFSQSALARSGSKETGERDQHALPGGSIKAQ